MTIDSVVTLVGTIVTIIATIIAIRQAKKAEDYKEQIKFDIRKINLSGTSERLKRAQDDIRALPTDHATIPRGMKVSELILNIKSQFDFALSAIDSKGPDKDIRALLTQAQNKLNNYELGLNSKKIDPKDPHELQSLVQDAISQSSSRIFALEGKA
ncbi:hypothetical protein AS299_02575 [Citrobacter freundii]|nr:hypothetical protein AS299_02575 [Citrobacter freundii]